MRCITARERREVVDLFKKRGEGGGEGNERGTRKRGGRKRATRRVVCDRDIRKVEGVLEALVERRWG